MSRRSLKRIWSPCVILFFDMAEWSSFIDGNTLSLIILSALWFYYAIFIIRSATNTRKLSVPIGTPPLDNELLRDSWSCAFLIISRDSFFSTTICWSLAILRKIKIPRAPKSLAMNFNLWKRFSVRESWISFLHLEIDYLLNILSSTRVTSFSSFFCWIDC